MKIRRCAAIALIAGSLGIGPAPFHCAANAQAAVPEIADEFATLQQQLEFGLQARRPEEFAFIRKVVRRVNQGKLTRNMVLGTFEWAIETTQSRNYPYPMPYFEEAMRRRAAEIGVKL